MFWPGEDLGVRVEDTVVITETGAEPKARRAQQEPAQEIGERIETFARQRGYKFNEDKQMIVDGLLEKSRRFGDFYCPCKFDNVPENVCPCEETRMGRVVKEGRCY